MVKECQMCDGEFETDDSEQDYCADCNIEDEEDDYDEVDDDYDEHIRTGE